MNDTILAPSEVLSPFLESLPWPAIALDEEGRVICVNNEMSVLRPGDRPLRTGTLQQLFPDYHAALGGDLLTPQETVAVRQAPEGAVFERIWLRRLPGGARLVIVMDQTRWRKLEVADAQTTRLASLGFMAAGVCHEVSNPLAAVHSMVQILQADKQLSPEMLDKGLTNIAANVKRILDLSKRLLCFSRVGDEPRTAFRLHEAIDEALVVLRQDRHFGQIEIVYQPDPGAVVLGNRGQIQEAFYNIFLNAVQAMAGQGRLSVAIGYPAPGRVEVAIRDSGPGISPQFLPRLFEPFFTTKPVGQGTGLGLSIGNEIVQEHGGAIRAENDPHQGAWFFVQLPLHERLQ